VPSKVIMGKEVTGQLGVYNIPTKLASIWWYINIVNLIKINIPNYLTLAPCSALNMEEKRS
jgi:hypothetical protein